MPKRLTTEEFIEKSKKVHGDKYDYSLVEYTVNHKHIKIICPKHGEYVKTPLLHLLGQGCKICSGKQHTTEIFIKNAKSVHGNKYDYSLVDYKNGRTKVKIICKKHGIFEQTPEAHYYDGDGCSECSGNKKMTTDTFIKKSLLIHGNKYDYNSVLYVNNRTKVNIKCDEHGYFMQSPDHHLVGGGCPYCKNSIGENFIALFLENNNFKYVRQKQFDGCLNPITNRKLPFDFYLPDLNVCIEYDGLQHFKSVEMYGGQKYLEETQFKDEIRNDFCNSNGIKLLRIKYDKNVKNKVNKILNSWFRAERLNAKAL